MKQAGDDPKLAERLDAYWSQIIALVEARAPVLHVPPTLARDVAEANTLLCAGDSSDWRPSPPRRKAYVDRRAPHRAANAIDQADWFRLGGELDAA